MQHRMKMGRQLRSTSATSPDGESLKPTLARIVRARTGSSRVLATAARVLIVAGLVAGAGAITTTAGAPKQAVAADSDQVPAAPADQSAVAPTDQAAAAPTDQAPAAVPEVNAQPCRDENSLLVTKQTDKANFDNATPENGLYKATIPVSGSVATTTKVITAEHLAGTAITSLELDNQVGVSSSVNQHIIFTAEKKVNPTDARGVLNIIDWNVDEKKPFVQPAPGPANPTTADPKPGGVAGVVNLSDGLFYFGSVGGDTERRGYAMVNTYNPRNPTDLRYNEYEVQLGGVRHEAPAPGAPPTFGGNGDYAFDSNGSFYIMTSNGEKYWLYIVEKPGVIEDPSNPKYRYANLLTSGNTKTMNGFAFGTDGYIYASNREGGSTGKGALTRFNPANGAKLATFDLDWPTDLGSCADPNRIRVFKNLPGGRFNDTDQFLVEITAPELTAQFRGVTAGTDLGLQDQAGEYAGPAVGVIGAQATVFTISESPEDKYSDVKNSTTKLENYDVSWSCIDLAANNGVVIASGTGPTGTLTLPPRGGDDVVCTFTNIPKGEIKLQKDLPKSRIKSGDQFRLSITPGAAPDATTTGNAVGLQAQTTTLTGALPGTQYTITEHAAGTTNLSDYSATWACVDNGNGGKPVANGTGFSGTFTLAKPGGPKGQKIVCTFTNVPIMGTIVPSKSVNPPDGSTVYVGDTLTYTLTFANAGPTPANVDYTDDFSGVVDDAEMTAAPTLATGTGLSLGAPAGGKFTITGQVPGMSTATVTYQVKVKADDQRGDNDLLNYLMPTGTTTPPNCPAGNNLCTENPVPEPVVTKSVDPTDGSTVLAGQTLTYTLTFDNTLGKGAAPLNWTDNVADVLDDATVVSEPLVSNAALTASGIANNQFAVTGSLPAGTKATVTYRVQVKPDGQRGNNDLLNFLFPTGTTPPTTCAVGDPLCTENPVPQPGASKVADPPSLTAVQAGQTVTYTLKFDNLTGKAPATIAWDDDISGVLDDATLTAPPTSSDPSLTVTAPSTRGVIKVTGTLAPGKTVTVTYKVQVKPDDQRGDNILLNFLFPPGTEPPTTCVVGNPLCTAHPVPQLVVSKSVDPPDGSQVTGGQPLTYTMTFNNAKGKGPAEVVWDDNLSRVLDDAIVTAGPTASNPALTVSAITNGIFTVRGTLAPGQTVTVSMKVQVKPDGQRGDNDLVNFLMKPGPTLPATCVAGDPLCTENPIPSVPSIELDKTVVVVTETAGTGLSTPGDVVTYGFKVTNTGNVPLTNIVLTDPKLSQSPLTCPKTTLQPAESMNCTGPNYTLTTADLAAGRAVNVATVTGKPPVGPNVNDTDDVSVPVNPPTVMPTTGGNFPKQAERLAPALIIVGALLMLVASRRRKGLSVYFK